MTLVALVWGVFGQAVFFDFVNYDDPEYLDGIQELTSEGILHVLRPTTIVSGNWHPLTMLSLMVDRHMFGPQAWGFHATNVLFHSFNALLVFGYLADLTGHRWSSAWIAALFAIHPLRAESVAWITERKDVLFAFFGILSLWAYLRFIRHRRWSWFVSAWLLHAASLLSKPMLVTLPALMLLLDIWPMNRCVQAGQIQWRALAKCLAEKLPFVGLTLAFAVLTLWTQQTSGAVVPESLLPLAARLERVGAAYMAYVGMTLWPSSLRVFYPYIKDLDQLSIHAGWGILLVISFLAVANGRRFPWCLVGWCWFLGTLVPVIGIIQVGQCRYADRYSYFPQLGLWLAIVMPLCAWAERSKRRCVCSICLGIAGLLVLSQLCFLQVQTWHDSKSLWMHALTTEEHYYKRGKLAEHLIYIGDFEAARFQLEKGLAMVPNEARLYLLLGMCCSSEGDFENARRAFEQVILLEPERPEAHHNLGDTLMALGDLKGAEEASRRALQLNPQLVAARGNLAMLLFRKGKVHEALKHATQAATEGPREPSVQLQFGTILAESGHWHEAETVLEKSLSLKESLPMAHFYLAKAAERRGETPRAVSHFYRLTELPLENPDAFLESAVYLLQHQQESAGRAALERLTRLAPDYVPSQELLKRLLAQ